MYRKTRSQRLTNTGGTCIMGLFKERTNKSKTRFLIETVGSLAGLEPKNQTLTISSFLQSCLVMTGSKKIALPPR